MWHLQEVTADADWAKQICGSEMTSLVSEPMKPQYGFLWESCSMRSVCSRISTLDILPTELLHPFLVHPSTANHGGEMRLLSSCGHKRMFILPFRKGVFLSHSWFQVMSSSERGEEAGEGAVRGGGQGETLRQEEEEPEEGKLSAAHIPLMNGRAVG